MSSSEYPKPWAARLEEGASLPGVVEKAAADLGVDFLEVTGFGSLASARIDAGGGDQRTFTGPLTLLSLNGRVRRAGEVTICDMVCTFSRSTGNGIEVLGGVLVEAETIFAELSFTALDVLEVDGQGGERVQGPGRIREDRRSRGPRRGSGPTSSPSRKGSSGRVTRGSGTRRSCCRAGAT